jgi:uncharacterized membrane protein YhaH (DUF805 family)
MTDRADCAIVRAWRRYSSPREKMTSDDVSLMLVLGCFVGLLSIVIGVIVELSGGRGSLLWEISLSLYLLAVALIGIDKIMIITRRAHHKNTTVIPTFIFGILLLLTFGSAFICSIVYGVLQ